MDRVTKAERSVIMSRIRGQGNKRTEMSFASRLRKEKITGWRRHLTIKLTGDIKSASDGTKFKPQVRPDFTFARAKTAIFVDGCFWHGCPRCYRQPKSRGRFWHAKIQRNQERDIYQTRALKQKNWRVLRIWEHELTRPFQMRLRQKLQRALQLK